MPQENAPSSHKAKQAIEEYLKASGLAWTILRPAAFFEIGARLYPVSQGVLPLHGLAGVTRHTRSEEGITSKKLWTFA